MSSIIGRFLNYLLVPMYTACMAASGGGYGIITNIYAYVALILVILTFGMETTFFRFANKEDEDARTVLSNSFLLVLILSAFFIGVVLIGLPWIASAMGYADCQWYVGMMAAVVAIDSVQCVLFAWLRYEKKALKFAGLKLFNICLNISLNVVYYLVLGYSDPGPAFAINLLCSASLTLLLVREIRMVRWHIEHRLMLQMLSYSWPLLILGIAGILNQTADKILFPYIYGKGAQVQLGIYGACVKIAMIMAMITQAFRYAYEPFVFSATRDADAKTKYAVAMKYFLIFTLLAFLCVMGGMPVLKHIIAPSYWDGLDIVPIVMVAEIMMGVYFNLSFWYKLIDRTIYGAWFSLVGCIVLIAVNIIFVPQYSYHACAWGGVAGYGTAMLLSYIIGQRKNPIPYEMKSIMVYVVMSAFFYAIMVYLPQYINMSTMVEMGMSAILILAFVSHVWYHEFRRKKNNA